MNYRHAFHAGNFADCVKHAVLVWLLRALQRKPAPAFVLDSHAGPGWYDLVDGPAARTGEWREGIGKLLREPPEALADYVGVARAAACRMPVPRAEGGPTARGEQGAWTLFPRTPPVGSGGESRPLCAYPGSPLLIRALLRQGDRLTCCERHPEDHAALRRLFARDPFVSVHHRNAWEALRALLPPREHRGLILIDPPYESPTELADLAGGLRAGWTRFRTGVFVAWYPIKHRTPVRALHAAMREAGIRDIVAAEFVLRTPLNPARLNGCGLLVINPPYRFESEVPPILAALLERLASGEAGEGIEVIRLVDE
jgi:23S rRNA (adenine2030-N6)-methyltransferase